MWTMQRGRAKPMYRLLIADDDRAACDLLVGALSTSECHIEVVSRGRDVLRRAGEGKVDILIAEVHLADLPAWELSPEVHRIDAEISVITVTADKTWATAKRVRGQGEPVFFYGLKPLNVSEMQEVVQGVVEWRRGRLSPGDAG